MKLWLFLWLWQSTANPGEDAKRAMTEGRFADAAKLYASLAKANPQEPLIRLNLGVALYSDKQYAGAVTALRAFLRSQPAHPQANLLLASALLKMQKACDALSFVERAKAALGQRAEYFAVSAEARLGCLDFSGALADYEALARLEPTNPKAWYGLGRAQLELQKTEEAKESFARLSTLPFSAELRQLELDVARGLSRAKRDSEAIAAYERLLAAQPRDAEAEYEIGILREKVESAEAALPHYERAVAFDPKLMAAQGALGRALLQIGRGRDAIAPLEKAARSGLDKSLWAALANAYRAAGRTQDAQRALAKSR